MTGDSELEVALDRARAEAVQHRHAAQRLDCTYGDTPGLIHCPPGNPCVVHEYEAQFAIAQDHYANARLRNAALTIDLRDARAHVEELVEVLLTTDAYFDPEVTAARAWLAEVIQ